MYSPQNRVIVKELLQENKTVGGVIISPTTADVDNLAKLGVEVTYAFWKGRSKVQFLPIRDF